MIDVVVAVGAAAPPAGVAAEPGAPRRSWPCAGSPITVADLASDIDLPVGVVRVLLGDLSQHGMIRILAAPSGAA